MKDFLGNEVEVGDYIFYSTTGRYEESRLCRVSRFTEKSMFVHIIRGNRGSDSRKPEAVVRNDFVKVDYHE